MAVLKNGLHPKVSIIGCGNVGMRYAYAMIIKGYARELVLVDYNAEKAQGEAIDLSHGAPYVSPVEIVAGDYPETAGSDLVVIAAGKNQKPGQTRIDLVKSNVEVLESIVPEVVKYSPEAIILVATNPVDILSYITYKISGKPKGTVIGSGTVLDSARLRYQIGERCVVDSRNVHAYILGEHGDSEFPAWSGAMIGGTPFKEYCAVCQNICEKQHDDVLNDIFVSVRDSAYEIIKKKGETSYGIGLSLARISKAVLNNENSILPVSSLVEDVYGVKDVYLSMPAIVNGSGVKKVLKMELADVEIAEFQKSAAAMREVLKGAGF
jgi:L-lactate dehydrogenase